MAGALTLTLACASTVLAKGGDAISPFPVTDALPQKQKARAMAVDNGGNMIVAGYTNVSGMNNDYQVTKFRADGSVVEGSRVVWRATFDKGGGDDQATAVVVDKNDNIIVTGTVWNGSNTDIHTIKYSSDGTLLWQHTFSGAAGSSDIATSIAVDDFGNTYVAGYSTNSFGNDDFLILKYPAAGSTPAWTEIYDSSDHSNDRIMAIAVGGSSLAVTGASSKGGIDFDILTRKYNLDGTLIWAQRKAADGTGADQGSAVRLDAVGNVIVTGHLYNGSNNDIYTAKYAAASPGDPIWENIYNGGNDDEPRALRVDVSGDVFVTGYTYTHSGNEDFYTVRYNSNGTKAASPKSQVGWKNRVERV
jgi:uncharacterized delta-60 repeat protein